MAKLNNYNLDIIGKKIISFNEIDSTNKYAMENFNDLANGTVILAKMQSNGRGRHSKTWNSPNCDNIYMSIVVKNLSFSCNVSVMTLVTGIAVCNAINVFLQNFGLKAQIKWPNDIIIGEKKVCGILVQGKNNSTNVLNNTASIVVGIGINVNSRFFDDELINKATSLALELNTNNIIKTEKLVAIIIQELSNCMINFDKGFEFYKNDYENLCININKECIIIKNNIHTKCRAIGINNDGSLLVDIDGEQQNIYSNEVSIRGINGYV